MATGEVVEWRIRAATKDDVPSILWMEQMHAEFSHYPRPYRLKVGEKEYVENGFGDKAIFHMIVAELKAGEVPVQSAPNPDLPSSKMPHNEKIVGHAHYCYTYSSREGRTLEMEDLFVREEYRGRSIGTTLMQNCAKIALESQCVHMHWLVLNWNSRALSFYERLGVNLVKELLTIKLLRPALSQLAAGEIPLSAGSGICTSITCKTEHK